MSGFLGIHLYIRRSYTFVNTDGWECKIFVGRCLPIHATPPGLVLPPDAIWHNAVLVELNSMLVNIIVLIGHKTSL